MGVKLVADHLWANHPGVRSGRGLPIGDRTADLMKRSFATWRAIGVIGSVMGIWIATGGFGHDREPFTLLNLCLSCLAAMQCFVLLIAAKRSDQISSELAQHTYEIAQRDYVADQQVVALLMAVAVKVGVEVPEAIRAQRSDGPSGSVA